MQRSIACSPPPGNGPLHALVHCAARCGAVGSFETVSAEGWRRYLEINLTGSFHVCQAAARHMIAAGNAGRIVAIGSVKAMAVDLAPYGITANLVHPGPIRVERNATLFDMAETARIFARHLPLGRPGKAEDVAQAVRFLADPATAFVTGAEIAVDGGLMAQILTPSRMASDP